MRIVVTGGAGFIGAHVVRRALREGHEVAVIDDLSTGLRRSVRQPKVTFVHASILDREALERTVRNADSIIHLAALASVPMSIQAPERTNAVNVDGTLAVLQAARALGVGHVTYASSSAVYGANPAVPIAESDWVRPISPYGVSKLASEQYTLAYRDCYGLGTAAFRFFNVYGPGQSAEHPYAAVIPRLASRIVTGEPLVIYGDGEQTRDFVHVDQVAATLVAAATQQRTIAHPVNLASGIAISVNRVAHHLLELADVDRKIEYRPARTGEVRHSRASTVHLDTLFPAIERHDFNEGIAQTLRWMAQDARQGGPPAAS